MPKSKASSVHKVIAVLLMLIAPLFFFKEYKTLVSQKFFSKGVYSDVVINTFKNKKEKSFVIFVFSDDESPVTEKNFKSISDQNYTSYKISFIDSSSTNKNMTAAKALSEELGINNKVTYYRPTYSNSFSDIYFNALQACKDEDIIVQLEACDWLANPHVLDKLNEIYNDPDVWLTYCKHINDPNSSGATQYSRYENGRKKTSKLQSPWLISNLKTYYVGLVKQIDKKTVFGEKGEENYEEDVMRALVQISKWHIRFIPEVLYFHSDIEKKSKNSSFQNIINFIFNPFEIKRSNENRYSLSLSLNSNWN